MSESATAAPQLPLFYAGAIPLSSQVHAEWRLLPGDAAFAANSPAAPLTVSEFAAASRSYPVVFTANDVSPVALMGLEQSNLFVDDGNWAEGTYVPAYVRRYPFLLLEAADKSGYALGIDETSPQVARGGDKGRALFDGNAPAEVTRQALEFCRLFNEDHLRTRAFADALTGADLLVDRRVDVELPGGKRMGVDGFRVVDAAKFAALDDARVLDWHKKGWLALVHYHLASLDRFNDLLARQNKRQLAPAAGNA